MSATTVRRYRRSYPSYRVNAYQTSATRPIAEINVTPLIDVMLVLLALLIMTVPLAMHRTAVDLPRPGSPRVETPEVALTIDPQGQVFWNGAPVDRPTLTQHLEAAAAQEQQPLVRFQPDPLASYNAAAQVIALTGDAHIENFAFIGNEQFRTFGR
ncbi:MAG: biopolymer transporter ExbD [Alteraurantiacibacter sp.]